MYCTVVCFLRIESSVQIGVIEYFRHVFDFVKRFTTKQNKKVWAPAYYCTVYSNRCFTVYKNFQGWTCTNLTVGVSWEWVYITSNSFVCQIAITTKLPRNVVITITTKFPPNVVVAITTGLLSNVVVAVTTGLPSNAVIAITTRFPLTVVAITYGLNSFKCIHCTITTGLSLNVVFAINKGFP